MMSLKQRNLVFIGVFAFIVSLVPSTAMAKKCESDFLGFPAWYSHVSDDCESVNITNINDLWIIPLNLIEILLRVVAYASIGYLVWGGFKYMKSRGDPSAIQNAKDAITNAVIGLVVALSATAIVEFVTSGISGDKFQFGLPKIEAGSDQLTNVMNNLVFPIAGAMAVIFIIIGGIQYTTSHGDPSATKKAKDTIIYSVVGLVFVIMAFAIVQLILGRFQ